MAAKKKGRPKSKAGDRHLSAKMVRVGDDLHSALSRLAERNSRPLTWELRRILIAELTREGLWPASDEDF